MKTHYGNLKQAQRVEHNEKFISIAFHVPARTKTARIAGVAEGRKIFFA